MIAPIVVSIVVGILTISVTILIFYAGINRKLDKLLDRQTLELSQTQAQDLMDIYLSMTKSEIEDHIRTFHTLQLAKYIKEKNNDAVYSAVFGRTQSIVLNQRNKLNSFRVKGGMGLKDFLDMHLPLETGQVAQHMGKIYEIYCEALDGNLSTGQCESAVLREAEKGFAYSRQVMKKELAAIYGLFKPRLVASAPR